MDLNGELTYLWLLIMQLTVVITVTVQDLMACWLYSSYSGLLFMHKIDAEHQWLTEINDVIAQLTSFWHPIVQHTVVIAAARKQIQPEFFIK
ncbi:hypothetical protein T10_3339 [Trichinella papuae]|uniref:Uncharacterized protein n=1 Tax=Trichinella papuae TaxID=268474 RepID=A0A0V1MBF3_9BILA|nr:hypothetical protein T10_3339 [Trichinella papuae]